MQKEAKATIKVKCQIKLRKYSIRNRFISRAKVTIPKKLLKQKQKTEAAFNIMLKKKITDNINTITTRQKD